MTTQRLLLGLGHFGREQRAALVAIAREAACHFECTEEPRGIDAAQTHAIVLDATGANAEHAAIAVRSDPTLARLPVLALWPEVGDLEFATAFTWGADDAVSGSKLAPLLPRLRALPRETPTATATSRGQAVIADPEQSHRVILGRVLRNAGYSVRFAATAADAWEYAAEDGVELFVLSTELDEAPRAGIERLRERSGAICIVNTAPRSLRAYRDTLQGLERVAANDSYGPAENVLFLTNDMKSAKRDQRTSTRTLYGTTVAFRGAGRHEDDYGFTYNVSAGGMYVRTLAVPEDDTVWFELCPPRAERRIRVVAQVQWRRSFGYSEEARIPPGFGAKVVDGARADLEAWNTGCEALSQALG